MVKKNIHLIIKIKVEGTQKAISNLKGDLKERSGQYGDDMWEIGSQNDVEVIDTNVKVK